MRIGLFDALITDVVNVGMVVELSICAGHKAGFGFAGVTVKGIRDVATGRDRSYSEG